MTLGEFKELTKNLSDDTILLTHAHNEYYEKVTMVNFNWRVKNPHEDFFTVYEDLLNSVMVEYINDDTKEAVEKIDTTNWHPAIII